MITTQKSPLTPPQSFNIWVAKTEVQNILIMLNYASRVACINGIRRPRLEQKLSLIYPAIIRKCVEKNFTNCQYHLWFTCPF